MGLDISAYRGISNAGQIDLDAAVSRVRIMPNPEFQRQADNLSRGDYAFEDAMEFCAGSYSRYNAWRDQLARLAGYPDAATVWRESRTGPFAELVNFSDCEGVIGPLTSAKLARDFAEFQTKADAVDEEWFRALYAEWRAAFEMAADRGAVTFH